MSKIKLYVNYLTFLVCLLIPKKKNRWVFGAWFGNRISDNPYALYRYVKQNMPDIECVWICNDVSKAIESGVDAVRRNSIAGVWKCLTAKVAVMNQGYLDFGDYNWVYRSYKAQLWHGIPWKKIGEDTKDKKSGVLHKISHRTFLFANKCDLYISPSDETRKVIKSAFLTDDTHILSVGQPRNEVLMDQNYCENAGRKLKNQFGNCQKIVVYMPTFRDNSANVFSFLDIADEVLPILKKHNAILLEKQHYIQYQRSGRAQDDSDRIINVENYETQDLLAAADLLVTDYSSCFFDFLLRDKPVIHYIYDYDMYKNKDRGLYYDLDYVSAGFAVKTKSDLLSRLEAALDGEDTESNIRKTVRERFDSYETPDDSKIIFNEILRHIQ